MNDNKLNLRAKASLRSWLRRYKSTSFYRLLKLGLGELEPWREQFFPFAASERSLYVATQV